MMLLMLSPTSALAFVAILVLAGLLLVYLLLRGRIGELSHAVARMQGELARLSVALVAVEEATRIERATPPPPPLPVAAPVPAELPPIEVRADVDLSQVEAELAELRKLMTRLAERPDPPPVVAKAPPDIREVIESRFRGQGYDRVRVLLADGAADPCIGESGSRRVSVEGARRGLTYKGYVVIEHGRVIEEKMTSSHEVFP